MSGDVLREAARLMRERAEAATPGPWHGDDDHPSGEAIVWAGQATVAEVSMPIPPEFGLDGRADREHIASWHPAVALAVAEVLSFGAETWSDARCVGSRGWDETCGECENCVRHWMQVRLVAVARDYLGKRP